MLKKLFLGVVSILIWAGLSFAADVPINVSATVPESAAYTMVIHPTYDGSEDWDTEVSEMIFGDNGELTNLLANGDNAGCWYSRKGFMVIFYMGSGAPYSIAQTGTYLVGQNTGSTIPKEAFGFTPVYVCDAQYCDPGNDLGGPRGTLADASYAQGYHAIYQSDAAGTGETIRVYYSIPPYPAQGDPDWWAGWQPIPLTQDADTYTGTVTFTVTQ